MNYWFWVFSCIHTKSQLALLQFSIGKSDNLGIFWKLFVAIANAAHLLQMLWTKIDVCNLKSIRPNLKSMGAKKSDSQKLFVAIARALLLSIQHYTHPALNFICWWFITNFLWVNQQKSLCVHYHQTICVSSNYINIVILIPQQTISLRLCSMNVPMFVASIPINHYKNAMNSHEIPMKPPKNTP